MNFVYKAYLPDGRTESGQIAADTAADAVRVLAGRGRSAFEVAPSEKAAREKRAGRRKRCGADVRRFRKAGCSSIWQS